MAIETNFKVLKDEQGEVIGFSLIAKPQAEAELFCSSFPKALLNDQAEIKFDISTQEIVFDFPDCKVKGRCAHKLEKEEFIVLSVMLNSKEDRLQVSKAGMLTPGFKIHRL